MELHRCLCCFAANASELRFTVKGAPYLRCRLCQCKVFMSNLESLRGAAIVPVLIEAAIAKCARDPAYAQWFNDTIAAVVRHVQENGRPAPGEIKTPMGESLAQPFEPARTGT